MSNYQVDIIAASVDVVPATQQELRELDNAVLAVSGHYATIPGECVTFYSRGRRCSLYHMTDFIFQVCYH